jgi:hypothetical protein
MPYHTPIITCGCGQVYPIHNFLEQKDAYIGICCSKCGSLFEVTVHVPKDLLIQDVVQKAEFEKIHGKVK